MIFVRKYKYIFDNLKKYFESYNKKRTKEINDEKQTS